MLNTVYSTNIYLVLRYYIGDEDGNSMASDSDHEGEHQSNTIRPMPEFNPDAEIGASATR